MITDSEFIAAADGALAAIGEALDAALADSDVDVDWSLNDGILEIECEDGGKLIVNRHVPNREIWVAARAGGFHFASRDGAWRDTRSGGELAAALAELLRTQAGLEVVVPALKAPATGP
jgi:CyaY protein